MTILNIYQSDMPVAVDHTGPSIPPSGLEGGHLVSNIKEKRSGLKHRMGRCPG